MIQQNLNKNSFFLSILLHLTVASIIFFTSLSFNVENNKKIGQKYEVIQATLFQLNEMNRNELKENEIKEKEIKQDTVKEINNEKNVTVKNNIVIKQKKMIAKISTKKNNYLKAMRPSNQNTKSQARGMDDKTFKGLVHDAIQKQQVYPESAILLEREGRVTVRFLLYPDGHVTNVKIIKPADTKVLNDAAIKAVLNAQPIQKIDKYLTAARDYQIDLVFELT